MPPKQWAPVVAGPVSKEPGAVVFVDGVRRIEARVWIPDADDTGASMGVAASYASGAVCCCPDGGAHMLVSEQRRGLFTTVAHTTDVATKSGEFRACGRNEDQRRLCSAERMYVPPVRSGK